MQPEPSIGVRFLIGDGIAGRSLCSRDWRHESRCRTGRRSDSPRRDAQDAAAAADLIDEELVYVNTLYDPFEIRGREAYLAFGASLSDFYTAPRSHEILGIDAFTPTMACLRLRVTVGEVSVLGLSFHYVRDGRLVEMIDVVDDRGRALAPYINTVMLSRLKDGE